ncbi:hypothetical protein [Puniceibacterium sediminis]|uniref:Uncharacterized protein n=1 Tax=Puniceibacterium sediminis TaxID=1608407 RepID=A0A238Z7T7_9RHOB|nr:hypothetical protein [Puniceibacterium sediminis]SNR79300.1 hypothetical protein SAMN06265370_12528 [Puniceibacterium sediminis]
MEQKLIATGLGALIVGYVLGTFSGPNLDDIGAKVETSFSATGEALSGGVSSLGDQITALTARLDSVEANVASAATAAADTTGLDALGARLDALSGEIGDGLAKAQSDIAGKISDLGSKISSAAMPAPAATAVPTAAATAAAAPAAAPADNASPPQGLTAGNTAVFGDGAVRAFVSRVGDGTARISVNGNLTNLSAGESMTVGDCLLMLNSVDRGHADISGACGSDVPAATGFGPGEAAMFDDGATRVFISGVSEDGSAARIAVNGLVTQSVAKGESVSVGGDSNCSVVVEGIDRGHVQLGYICGS